MTSIHLRILTPLSFFIFISYIIFLADTADYNFAFRVVGYIPSRTFDLGDLLADFVGVSLFSLWRIK